MIDVSRLKLDTKIIRTSPLFGLTAVHESQCMHGAATSARGITCVKPSRMNQRGPRYCIPNCFTRAKRKLCRESILMDVLADERCTVSHLASGVDAPPKDSNGVTQGVPTYWGCWGYCEIQGVGVARFWSDLCHLIRSDQIWSDLTCVKRGQIWSGPVWSVVFLLMSVQSDLTCFIPFDVFYYKQIVQDSAKLCLRSHLPPSPLHSCQCGQAWELWQAPHPEHHLHASW